MKIAQYVLHKLNPHNQSFCCFGTFFAHPKLSKQLLHCIYISTFCAKDKFNWMCKIKIDVLGASSKSFVMYWQSKFAGNYLLQQSALGFLSRNGCGTFGLCGYIQFKTSPRPESPLSLLVEISTGTQLWSDGTHPSWHGTTTESPNHGAPTIMVYLNISRPALALGDIDFLNGLKKSL